MKLSVIGVCLSALGFCLQSMAFVPMLQRGSVFRKSFRCTRTDTSPIFPGSWTLSFRQLSSRMAMSDDYEDDRSLFDYIFEEDVKGARAYLARGGPVHVASALGVPSLVSAVETNNLELVKLLTSAEDANVNYPSFHGGQTPLIAASVKGYASIVRYLVEEAGANINVTDNMGDTALNSAYYWGQVEVLKILLEQGSINTEIANIQSKRPGDSLQREIGRDDSKDEEMNRLLKEFREARGFY
ncbi:unnamed protein product [Choristocarpus tenellus]